MIQNNGKKIPLEQDAEITRTPDEIRKDIVLSGLASGSDEDEAQAGINQFKEIQELSFLHYAISVLGYKLINAEEHGLVIAQLERLIEHRRNNEKVQEVTLIMLPRNTYKTTLAATAFPMFWLEHFPNDAVLVDSKVALLSEKILSEIKQQYENGNYSRNVRKINPYKSPRWTASSMIVPWRKVPRKEGSIDASGIDKTQTGNHYKLIIADDLHDEKNSLETRHVSDVLTHIRLLLSLLEPGGVLIIIGTRWTLQDAYETVEKEIADHVYQIAALSLKPMNLITKHVKLYEPLWMLDNTGPFGKTIRSLEGFLNFPKTLPIEHLYLQLRRQKVYIYSAQYLLSPIASEKQKFDIAWLKFYSESPGAPKPGEPGYNPALPPLLMRPPFKRIGIVDPAFTKKETSDYSGLAIASADHERNIFLLMADKIKLDPTDLIKYMLSLTEEYEIAEWYIEDVAAQRVLNFFLEYMADKEGINLRDKIFGIKTFGKKKTLRILSLQPYFEHGKIWIKPSMDNFINQYTGFPLCSERDILDAVAYLPQVIYDGEIWIPEPVPLPEFCLDRIDKQEQESEGIRPLNWETVTDG